jgi:predicted transposase YbfD/YdcC
MENILFITISAIISGCDTWDEIEDFGHNKKEWLSKYLDMPNGTPSHDTLNRFFSGMDVDAFEQCFRKWASSLLKDVVTDVISLDGKTIKGSRGNGRKAIHMVSAWSKSAGLSLGQVMTHEKSNEITAIPELLDALFLEGAIVTIDAMGTQPHLAEKILSRKADYVLPVKKNRKFLFLDLEESFRRLYIDSEHETEDDGHGRIEKRKYTVIEDDVMLRTGHEWPGLNSIIRFESETVDKISGVVETNTLYYLTSLSNLTGERAADIIRSHWEIENKLHWMLDVSFGEDADKKRNKNAIMNFSAMNKMALSALSKDDSIKIGVKSKRKKALANDEYREHVLAILVNTVL